MILLFKTYDMKKFIFAIILMAHFCPLKSQSIQSLCDGTLQVSSKNHIDNLIESLNNDGYHIGSAILKEDTIQGTYVSFQYQSMSRALLVNVSEFLVFIDNYKITAVIYRGIDFICSDSYEVINGKYYIAIGKDKVEIQRAEDYYSDFEVAVMLSGVINQVGEILNKY